MGSTIPAKAYMMSCVRKLPPLRFAMSIFSFLSLDRDVDAAVDTLVGGRPVEPLPDGREGAEPQGLGVPVGRVIRVTVPWPGNELTLMPPSYFFTRCPASVRPSPIAPSREV